ncbi:MAG TPA: RHS repeat-associated core domain-containing protein [Cellvibrio sp.]|nr:RHS repeat-associated core domain-containing protein [Cellvibrio sp.]
MNQIEFSDSEGNRFQLSTAKPTLPEGVEFINALPRDIRLTNPITWSDTWKTLFPKVPFPQLQEKITQAINLALMTRVLYLIPLASAKPKPRMMARRNSNGGGSAGSNSGDSAGNSSTSEKVAAVFENVVKPHMLSPEAAKVCDDINALSQVKNGKVTKDALTGASSLIKTCKRGCPISMVSGEEVLTLDDFTLPGPLPFTWKRTYRSGHDRDLGLGPGWTYAGCERLYEGAQEIELSDDEGRILSFKRPQVNQRSKLLNEQMSLDHTAYETYILRQHGQPHKVFTRLGQGSIFRLTQILHPAYNPAALDEDERGFSLALHYSAQDRISKIAGSWGKSLLLSYGADGHIASISLCDEASGARMTVAEYDYSEERDLIAQRDSAGRGERYNYKNHLFTQRTLSTGFSYYYEWDAEDITARCLRTWGDRGVYDYRFSWDSANNLSRAIDSRGFTSEFVYNEFGLLTRETDNEGGVHRYAYENGLRTQYTDPEGHITRYAYDAAGHFVGVIDALDQRQTHYYHQDKLLSSADKDGALWQRSYNARGLLHTLTAPDGQVTRYSYNAQGLLSQKEDPGKRINRYQWNQAGELIALISPENHKQTFKYNTWGQVVQADIWLASRQHGGTTHYFYSPIGELQRVVYADGQKVDIAYNANGQIERLSDRRGRVTHFQYDGLSQVVSRTDAEGNSLAYEYDTERNLIRLSNENGDDYQFLYDGNERLIKEVGFDGRIQHYKYNSAGHLIKHLDAGEVITEFERDVLGRLLGKTSRALADAEGQTKETNRYLYDPVGRLKETYNSDQYLAFHYDRMGHLVKEHHSDLNDKRQRVSESMVDIHYTRSASGQLKKIQLPDRQFIAYDYDTAERLQQIMLNGSTITQIERDALGFETHRRQGDVITQSDYDPMGRLVKQQAHSLLHKQHVIDREYHYNAFGNLSSFKDGDWEVRYIYDMVDRLKRTEGDLAEHFVFDPAGNLLAQSKKETGNTTRGNRLNLQGDRKFEYDARGNLIRETRGKGGKLETLFTYNLNNQLIKVSKQGQTSEYRYDPLGRRIRKQDSFGTTQYLWAGDQLAQEQRNNIKKTYAYEPESFRPVAMTQDGEIYHYHLDHLGTPRELTNQQGSIVWKARYKTYGNLALKEVEEVENNLRFQGQYFDEETGLHYNRHRYYDPSLGQFITQDPIGLLGGVNNYQYAPNPVGWVDPFGLICKENQNLTLQTNAETSIGGTTTFYHGTSAKIASEIRAKGIDLSKGSRFSDFGQGFYMTGSKEEALKSASRLYSSTDVVIFVVPNSELHKLSILGFSKADGAWQDFVKFHKENGPTNLLHGSNPYDMVKGPLYRRYSGPEQTPIPWTDREDQISIHTDKAAKLFNRYMKP